MNPSLSVSVIIPIFNSEKTLMRAIESVFNQTLKPKRLILIDDCSTDETYAQILALGQSNKEISISVIRNSKNLGPGYSRNLGWGLADTEWIAFLDADDSWHPKKLELQFRAITENPNLDMICTQTQLQSTNAQIPEVEELSQVQIITFRRMLFKNEIPTRSVLARTQIPFRFPKGHSEDFAIWLEMLHGNLLVGKINSPLSFHHRQEFSSGGLSSQLVIHEFYELRNLFKYFSKEPILISLASLYSFLKFIRRVALKIARSCPKTTD